MAINMFFDTEFTGLRHMTELISIGCVIGNSFFYGEIMHVTYDNPDIDEDTQQFLKENVIPGLLCSPESEQKIFDQTGTNVVVRDSKNEVASKFISWLGQFNPSRNNLVIPVSDVMYYDMVLLMDLLHFGKAGWPADSNVAMIANSVSPMGYDLCQEMAAIERITLDKAFDLNREEYLDKLNPENARKMIPTKKHNALYDARIIKMIYDALAEKIAND